MSLSKEAARSALRARGLRATPPRVAVLVLLAGAERPLSFSEVLEQLGPTDWDPATTFRNLVKLRDAGLAPVVSRAEGLDRYAYARAPQDAHQHPHFVCDDCGRVECLPAALTATLAMAGPWAASIEGAEVQLKGACPDCRAGGGR